MLDRHSVGTSVENSLLKLVTERIEQISKDLLNQYQKESVQKPIHLTLQNALSEKRLEFPDVELRLTLGEGFSNSKMLNCEIARMTSNLINNAVEAGCTLVSVNATETHDRLKIVVSDNGRGMEAGLLSKIQNGESLSTRQTGSGLGLRQARQLAAKLGGTLEVNSECGIGTRIVFSVPL